MSESNTTVAAEPTLISHAQFAEFAGRMASHAASWAADSLTFKDRLDEPMRGEALARFTERMKEWLEAINGK